MRYGIILRVSMMPLAGFVSLLSCIDVRYGYARLSGVKLRVSMVRIGRICLFILAVPAIAICSNTPNYRPCSP